MNFKLTEKEKEICEYILEAKGRVNRKEIAQHFYITGSTAYTHLRSIYQKLDVYSKSELVYKLMKGQENSLKKQIDTLQREYLEYTTKGTEPKAIAVINRDDHMYRFLMQVKEFERAVVKEILNNN